MPLKKSNKILILIVIVLLFILWVPQFLVSVYFQKRIIERLQKEIIVATDSSYSAKIGHFDIDILSASLRLEAVEFLNVKEKRDYVRPLYHFTADRIKIENFAWMDLIRNNDFKIHKLVFENPQMKIWQGIKMGKATDENKDTTAFSFYKIIQPVFNSLAIKKIEVENAGIIIYKPFSDTTIVFNSRDNNVDIRNFRIDESASLSGRYFLADTFNVDIRKFTYVLADGLYTLKAQHCETSYTDSSMKIVDAELIPNYSKKEFDDEVGHQTDRMKINAASVQLTGMNVNLFFEDNTLIAQQLLIDSLNLYAFRDKNLARKPEEIPSLQKVIKSLPLYMAVEKVKVLHSTITYEEVAPGQSKSGRIFFSDVNATLTGLINDSASITSENKLVMIASSRFMNSGKVEAQYTFPMQTDLMVFDCKGSITGLKMTDLNQIVEPNANIKIKEGVVDKMEFDFKANDIRSTGKMTFLYHDLVVELKDKQTHQTKFKEDVLSFLVNKIIIKRDNPLKNKEVRITPISYERNRQRFIFNYTWKSLLSGIKPTIGLPNKK